MIGFHNSREFVSTYFRSRPNLTSLGLTQRMWNKKLAHELKHIEYSRSNPANWYMWRLIRINSAGAFDLADGLGSNGHCSTKHGHEKHNPENIQVCNIENNY